jgi:hypothetical protein
VIFGFIFFVLLYTTITTLQKGIKMKLTTNLTPSKNTISQAADNKDIEMFLKRAPVLNEEAEVTKLEITENKETRLLVIELVKDGKKGKLEWEL